MRKSVYEAVVTSNNTAEAMGSGSLAVLATPALVAMLEKAACMALEGILEKDMTTVGTKIEINHDAPTPLGMKVWAEATLLKQEGRKFEFALEARDEAGRIGGGTHVRVAVDAAKFQARANEKKG